MALVRPLFSGELWRFKLFGCLVDVLGLFCRHAGRLFSLYETKQGRLATIFLDAIKNHSHPPVRGTTGTAIKNHSQLEQPRVTFLQQYALDATKKHSQLDN